MTQQYHFASMTAQLFSTGISHHNLLHIPSIHLSVVNSSPRPGIAPQSLNSSSQPLRLPGECVPVRGMYGCGKDCLILIPFRLPQLSCFHLSLKCFSSDSDSCRCGNQTPASGPVLRTLLLFPLVPLSYQVLCLYIFFTTGQGLLSALSWGSACPSVSEVIFLMYP